MATTKSSAPAHPSTEDHDDTMEAHYASLERPHACYKGVVYIGHLAEDPETATDRIGVSFGVSRPLVCGLQDMPFGRCNDFGRHVR